MKETKDDETFSEALKKQLSTVLERVYINALNLLGRKDQSALFQSNSFTKCSKITTDYLKGSDSKDLNLECLRIIEELIHLKFSNFG